MWGVGMAGRLTQCARSFWGKSGKGASAFHTSVAVRDKGGKKDDSGDVDKAVAVADNNDGEFTWEK